MKKIIIGLMCSTLLSSMASTVVHGMETTGKGLADSQPIIIETDSQEKENRAFINGVYYRFKVKFKRYPPNSYSGGKLVYVVRNSAKIYTGYYR